MRLHVKLDVDYPDNDRIIEAGEAAELLYIRGLCMAKRMLTDGFISDRQLGRIGLPDVKSRAAALIKTGLWKRVRGGYKIPGWLDRNLSAKQVAELSKVRAAAGSKGGRPAKAKPEDD